MSYGLGDGRQQKKRRRVTAARRSRPARPGLRTPGRPRAMRVALRPAHCVSISRREKYTPVATRARGSRGAGGARSRQMMKDTRHERRPRGCIAKDGSHAKITRRFCAFRARASFLSTLHRGMGWQMQDGEGDTGKSKRPFDGLEREGLGRRRRALAADASFIRRNAAFAAAPIKYDG